MRWHVLALLGLWAFCACNQNDAKKSGKGSSKERSQEDDESDESDESDDADQDEGDQEETPTSRAGQTGTSQQNRRVDPSPGPKPDPQPSGPPQPSSGESDALLKSLQGAWESPCIRVDADPVESQTMQVRITGSSASVSLLQFENRRCRGVAKVAQPVQATLKLGAKVTTVNGGFEVDLDYGKSVIYAVWALRGQTLLVAEDADPARPDAGKSPDKRLTRLAEGLPLTRSTVP